MKKQLFTIVLILSYKLNGVVQASTTKVSTINPTHTSTSTHTSTPTPTPTSTSTSTPILIKSINTPGSPICTPVKCYRFFW